MKTLFGTFAALLMIAGCSGDDANLPTTVPVEGTVAYNGAPLAGAQVAFWTEGAPKSAAGLTDAEGKFKLSMYGLNDGAMVGTHKITVTKDDPNASSGSEMDMAAMEDPSKMADMMAADFDNPAGTKSLVPAKYATRNSTPLTETVSAEGPNTFVLQLTD